MLPLRIVNLLLSKKKPVVIIMKGLPGSGKSTLSKSICSLVPNTVIVSKDEIRKELWLASPEAKTKEWKKNWEGIINRPQERDVCSVRDSRIADLINKGCNVIVDDTNLNPVHAQRIREIAANTAYVEDVFVDTPVKECIERDKMRPASQQVGPEVIWTIFKQYLQKEVPNGSDGCIEKDAGNVRAEVRATGINDSSSVKRLGYLDREGKTARTPGLRAGSREGAVLDKNQESVGPQGWRKRTSQNRWGSSIRQHRFGDTVTNHTSPTTNDRRITFSTAVSKLLNWRKSIIGKEVENGWVRNSRNIWEFSWDSDCYTMNGSSLGVSKIYYADQNPNGRSYSARMVSEGKWRADQVGWMWTVLNGTRIWLAVASPLRTSDITPGYIESKDGRNIFYINI